MHTSTLPAPTRQAPAPPPSRPSRPRWERPALLALLAGTALLYLWNLSASGYANDFYAAAVQAGTESWKAWLFGSLDSGTRARGALPGGTRRGENVSHQIYRPPRAASWCSETGSSS